MPNEEEIALVTWKNIAKASPYAEQTLRKRFGKEMLDLGIIFRSHPGRCKKPVIWGWPPMIRQYFREKEKKGEL